MKDVIRIIIKKIPRKTIFDSHTIIFKLRQDFSDEYLKNYNGKSTQLYHADLGQIIAEFENDPVDRIVRCGKSWSKNVLDKYSPCACWKKP